MHAVLEAQRLEERTHKPVPALYIDAENALDLSYMTRIGVDIKNMTFSYPDYAEEVFEVMLTSLAKGYKLVVVDSVDALVGKAEIEGSMTDSHVGLLPRIMGRGLRKLCGVGGVLAKSNGVVLFINQIRMKVGVSFGNPETTSGGFALKYYSTYRIDMRAPAAGKITTGQKLSEDDDKAVELGRTTNCKVVKNKVFPPYRTAKFVIRYGIGIDRASDLVSAMEDLGVKGYHGMGLKKLEAAIRSGEVDASALTAELAAAERARREVAQK
jgi:recombination protein RecA